MNKRPLACPSSKIVITEQRGRGPLSIGNVMVDQVEPSSIVAMEEGEKEEEEKEEEDGQKAVGFGWREGRRTKL